MNLKLIFIATAVQVIIASILLLVGQLTLQPLPYALGIGIITAILLQLVTITLCNTYSLERSINHD